MVSPISVSSTSSSSSPSPASIHNTHLRGFIDGTHPFPPALQADGTPNPAYDVWIEHNSILLGWILSTLSDPVLAQVVDLESSQDVWVVIQDQMASNTEARQMQLLKELQNIQKGNCTMQDYLLRAKSLSDQLAASGNCITLLV
ncbi:hypothetical protein BVC80_1771g13 [Macleaya cordata]|uniref:Retrotransposon Copia-like N-terminal domain-containing protein n=1 Tax=Macleaya cordata TaxID=56857 RepID=A0A200QNP5_MACCD|nr:hypothetical protein BVC80_1771g13 [Macleaya cordata]